MEQSFSARIKESLVRQEASSTVKRCCIRAELVGLIFGAGSLRLSGNGKMSCAWRTENAAVAKEILRLMGRLCRTAASVRAIHAPRLGGRTCYEIICGLNELQSELGDYRHFFIKSVIPGYCRKSKCCRSAFFKGIFLGCGTVSSPKNGIRLEFGFTQERIALLLCDFLKDVHGIHAALSQRKGHWIVYLRDIQSVLLFFSGIGAGGAILEIENARIVREARNQANRAANCDSANIAKVLSASERQMRAIAILRDRGEMKRLPLQLREIAEAREENPEASLEELGMLFTPPLGKSGVYHRLKRIEEIAEAQEMRSGSKPGETGDL